MDVWAGMPLGPSGWGDLEESKAPHLPRGPAPSGLDLFHRLLLLDHSLADHLNEDCLNGSQLLVNFGLSPAAPLTPRQFALLCPALLYQIDSRVCIGAPAPAPPGDLLSGQQVGVGGGLPESWKWGPCQERRLTGVLPLLVVFSLPHLTCGTLLLPWPNFSP